MKKFLFLTFILFSQSIYSQNTDIENDRAILENLKVAVIQNNISKVSLLYPTYNNLPMSSKDRILTLWAKALLAKSQRNFDVAIQLYRQILAEERNLKPARLQLAITLFEDSQYEAAQDQFYKLRAENLPQQYSDLIEQYLNTISTKNSWDFSLGLTYLNDSNINNAPKNGTVVGNWLSPKKESGRGIGYSFDTNRKWLTKTKLYNELKLHSNGKYYWDNKKYNETTLRISNGIGWQNANNNIFIAPFAEQIFYAGVKKESDSLKKFSRTLGGNIDIQHWIKSRWLINIFYEYGKLNYRERKHMNGHYNFITMGNIHYLNAQQYFSLYIGHYRTKTRDKEDSFIRNSISFSWIKEWEKGISTKFSTIYARKKYLGEMPLFNITQKNKEWSASLSIWHRAIHFWGMTPRLTYNINKTSSNHGFYSYDKQNVLIELSKKF